MIKLRDVRPEERPAEKARRLGIASLSDRELLSLLLRSGCRGQDVTALSALVLEMEPRREGLLGLLHNSMQDYMRLRGVGEAKALQLVAIGELSKRIWRREAAKNLTTAFSDPGLCARYYMEALRHLEQEELHAAFLDTKLRFISDQLLSRGCLRRLCAGAHDCRAPCTGRAYDTRAQSPERRSASQRGRSTRDRRSAGGREAHRHSAGRSHCHRR